MESNKGSLEKKSKGEIEEALKSALAYYKDKGGIGEDGLAKRYPNGKYVVEISSIAKKFGVSRQVLAKHLNNKFKSNSGKFERLFDDGEEKIIVQYIQMRGLLAQPMTVPSLQALALALLKAKHQKRVESEKNPQTLEVLKNKIIKTPCFNWANQFLKRHDTEVMKKVGKMAQKQSKDPLLKTPEKSPIPKKLKRLPKSRKLFKSDPLSISSANSNRECQICLERAECSLTVWVNCDGGCGRWVHQNCDPELSLITENVTEELEKLNWLCPFCAHYGPFKERKRVPV